jgi:hypothetical protein
MILVLNLLILKFGREVQNLARKGVIFRIALKKAFLKSKHLTNNDLFSVKAKWVFYYEVKQ